MKWELTSFVVCLKSCFLIDWYQLLFVMRLMACMVWHPELAMRVKIWPYPYVKLKVTLAMVWESTIAPHVIHKSCHMSSRFECLRSWNVLFQTSTCQNNGVPCAHMVMSTHDVDNHDSLDLNDRSTDFAQFQFRTKSKIPVLVEIKQSTTTVKKNSNQVVKDFWKDLSCPLSMFTIESCGFNINDEHTFWVTFKTSLY